MTTPPPGRVHYALTSVYTNWRIGGLRGPGLLTGDPFVAAHFFLDHDRADELDVMIESAVGDADLTSCPPGDVVAEALRLLPAGDPRRAMLERAQSAWISDRLFYRGDPYPSFDTPSESGWRRAGELWAVTFATVPGPEILARLRADHPGDDTGGIGHLTTAASAFARAIRQAHGPVDESMRARLTDHVRTLYFAWEASAAPAARAASRWYLDRLAELDPATATPPRPLAAQEYAQWRRAGRDYQRDLAIRDPGLHEARTAEFADYTDRLRPGPAALSAEQTRAVEPPGGAGITATQPTSDEQAALAWRRAVPSARRWADDADRILSQAYTHVARAAHEVDQGVRPVEAMGDTVLARTMVEEMTTRHVVLGRLLALSDAERASEAARPLVHDDVARAVAETARSRALEAGAGALAAHGAAQAAYIEHVDAAERALDDALAAQRLQVRAVVAAHAPRDGGRPLLRELVADLERRMEDRLPGPALDTYRALNREFEDLQRDFHHPADGRHATEEQVARARERAATAYQRWEDLVRHEVPATARALRALRGVVALKTPLPEQSDGSARLQAHRDALTHQLHERRQEPVAQAAPAPARARLARAQQATHRVPDHATRQGRR